MVWDTGPFPASTIQVLSAVVVMSIVEVPELPVVPVVESLGVVWSTLVKE